MSETENKYLTATKSRLTTIRIRTWSLTLAIIVSLVLYLLVNITTRQSLSWIDFILHCAVQIIVHIIYFPDGDLFGQKDGAYISNKSAYNDKASGINQRHELGQLRKYCKVEFEERKHRYILNILGEIGITEKEFALLQQKTEKEIKHLKTWKVTDNIDGEEKERIIVFSKYKHKLLTRLLFKHIPVEENHPETIMSAVENDGSKAIKDGSIAYKAHSYIRKILMAVVVGGIFAYIGYTAKDGIGIAEIVQICMYLTSIFTTAVTAFSSGETCSKVYRSHYYLDLANFIDGFNEWNSKQPKLTEEKAE